MTFAGDYKKIFFSRTDGINVGVIANLDNPANVSENFLVLAVEGIDTTKETDLFYWLDKKWWTLTEFQNFALNNRMCLQIFDKAGNELLTYGFCTGVNRIHDLQFGINFD